MNTCKPFHNYIQSNIKFEKKPGEVEKERVQEIAVSLELPPRLKASAKALGIGSGVLTGLGSIAFLGPFPAVAAGAVVIAATIWKGKLPRSVSRIKWLRWAVQWDLEENHIKS